MSLHLYKRGSIWWIRGTVQEQRVRTSAETRDRKEAEQVRAKLEADLFKRSVYGAQTVATFREAATGYMKSGGEATHIDPIVREIGGKKLAEINQGIIDSLALKLKPKAAPSTRIRQVYTPILAVMNYAAENSLCDPIRVRKPKVKNGRTEWLTPTEAENWIDALAGHEHIQRLVIFYLGTGCRASEALVGQDETGESVGLFWKDVTLGERRAVLWDTKEDYARHVDLQERVRDALPERGRGTSPVFLNSRGDPWHGYDAINLMLRKIRARRTALIKAGGDLPELPHVHCHLFRHTWATWAYAVTHDITFLMKYGGWKSPAMVMHYTHAGTPELGEDVQAHGWTIRAQSEKRPQPQSRKSKKKQ